MFTTCTACGTQFRINTAQLRAVHGLVRCSRCQSVFDAFETLREASEVAQQVTETDAPAYTIEPPEDTSVPKIEDLEPIAIETASPAPPVPDVKITVNAKEPVPPMDDLFADLWGEPPTAKPAEPASGPLATQASLLTEDHIPKPPELARDQALYRDTQLPPSEPRVAPVPRRRAVISGWGVGAVVLLVLLAIQLTNANRLALSETAVIGPSLGAVYAALGHPLQAAPQPDSWVISSINVTSDPETPGALSITGSLQNHADFAQAWPLLRVELTDRYGDALRARDFTASEYLPANRPAIWLGSGMATHFRIDVVDPGPNAVGFQVQACLNMDNQRQCGGNAGAS
ncbi:MAG: DUF3426 domain-containing protein [Gammaproteobacteria bacterium]